jgi:hypothetical protein
MGKTEDERLWAGVWQVNEARTRGGMVEVERQKVRR